MRPDEKTIEEGMSILALAPPKMKGDVKSPPPRTYRGHVKEKTKAARPPRHVIHIVVIQAM